MDRIECGFGSQPQKLEPPKVFSVSTEFKLWSKDKMPTDWVIQSVPNLLLLR